MGSSVKHWLTQDSDILMLYAKLICTLNKHPINIEIKIIEMIMESKLTCVETYKVEIESASEDYKKGMKLIRSTRANF